MKTSPSKKPTSFPRHPIETIRVKVWFKAVALRSGKSAYALEEEFSPDLFIRYPDGTVSRPGLWDKYGLGKVTPGGGKLEFLRKRPNLVDKVEASYPNTAQWLLHPFWRAAYWPMAEHKNISSSGTISSWMKMLSEPARDLLFMKDASSRQSPFARRPINKDLCDRLGDIGTFDGAAALMLLVHESILIEDGWRFQIALNELHNYDSWFGAWPETSPVYRDILDYIDKVYGQYPIPTSEGGWLAMRRDWKLHVTNWWRQRDRPLEDA